MALRMAVYAAQIDSMDQGIGRIVAALEKAGALDNTFLLFFSDNGACQEEIHRGEPGTEALGTKESFESYGRSWANAGNTPFRLYKHYVHEGGIASPMIAHWPARILGKGEIRTTPGHVIDVMATALDVVGTEYPSEYNDHAITPLEGKSLVPSFGNQPIEREAIYWEHESNRAVRMGKWKLVSKGYKLPSTGPWELYDLDADRTETNDLASHEPERVARMAAAWQSWAKERNVFPLDGRTHAERIRELVD